jgi:hypothetical protein
MNARVLCPFCALPFWEDERHTCDGYETEVDGLYSYYLERVAQRRALAAATGTAKTRNGAECEASQSGLAQQGNAQPLSQPLSVSRKTNNDQ